MPPRVRARLEPDTRIWRPLGYDPSLPPQGREWGHHLQMFARLAPGIALDTAQRDLAVDRANAGGRFTRPAVGLALERLFMSPLQDTWRHGTPALRAVMTATLLLLLDRRGERRHLMLARGAERRRELATCAAFGASRLRLLTPLLAEGVLLGAVGGMLGVALAYAHGGRAGHARRLCVPRLEAIRVDRAGAGCLPQP